MSVIENSKKIILHIVPHLGGGVGRVVLNYLIKVQENLSFEHKVICLDYANDNAINIAKEYNIELSDNAYFNPAKILSEIEKSDITLIHWWNHPLLNDFLVRQKLPLSRVIFWSHISGYNPPYVFTNKALSYPDLFVFTTPMSFETKEVQNFNDKNKLHTVWSTGGIDHVKNISPKKHENFNVGYIGTVDYCKMHPDFLKICDEIDIPEITFTVCGGSSHIEIEKEAQGLGIDSKFKFTGLVPDISQYLCEFDILGYPLADYHYGTCDQVLAESMAAGVVPVVFDNKMEKYMVKNNITGIVVKTKEEYINAIKFLYQNPSERKKLSQNAKEYAFETFSLNNMTKEWDKIFLEALKMPKKSKQWNFDKITLELSYFDIFLESLEDYGNYFRNYVYAKNDSEKEESLIKIKEMAKSPLWNTKTKGTIHHYYAFFKEDKNIACIASIMSKIES